MDGPHGRADADPRPPHLAVRADPRARDCAAAWRRLTGGPAVRDPDRRTLVACSGGADSTALLLSLAACAGAAILAAHVVHDLRPADQARADADAVADLCRRLGVECHEASIRVRTSPGNAESNARRARYRALGRIAVARACPFIATGHQGDDLVETMLMRLIRGSGVRGLAGIPPIRSLGSTGVHVVRPMLALSRADTEALCRSAGVAWREDATNADTSRWRARLRRDVLPILRDLRPSAHRRALAAADLLREAADLIEHRAAAVMDRAAQAPGGALVWDRALVDPLGPGVLGEVLRSARARIAGPGGADRLGADQIQRVHRALADRDRRARAWEFAGLRIEADTAAFRIAPAAPRP